MPQARRKTPFSGKAKKQQLQGKKQNKTLLMSTGGGTTECDVVSVNYQPARGRGGGRDTNRYALKFYRETEDELRMKKEDALKELRPVPEKDMEVTPEEYFPTDLSFPKRPPWDFNMTPAQLDAQEQRYFKNYVDNLQASEHWKQMSYFELNLETWRQLWRVLEMCDVLLLIVDVRYAGMMFPPSLYSYIRDQNKDMILVLNKIDLVSASVVAAWKEYLTEAYPGLRVLYFTSCPAYNLRGATSDKAGLQVRRRKGKQRMCAEGATKILEACKEIVKGEVDLSSWEKKIKEETNVEFDYEEGAEVGETILEKADTSFYTHERYKSGVLTIGCVGQPNVGKSSLLNALMGRCVVSVSRTPGHTKHFQTIFLTPQVRLCDCPGLVFPSTVPRPIQILMGSYPIAQLREPYTTIRYVAERMDLPKLLRIQHPEGDESWSPRDICDGWAKKRSYLTAKAARLDTYRAANSLLRMALDGRICLWLRPPGFTDNKDKCTKSLPLTNSKQLLTMPWWSEELAAMKRLVATKKRRIRNAAPVRKELVVSRYLEQKEIYQTALKTAHEENCKGFCEKYETCEEIKYVRWVQALSDAKSDEVLTSESDGDRQSDGDDNSGSSDDEETTAMANKFAALAGDGDE